MDHWIELVALRLFDGILHRQFQCIGCTLFGIVRGCWGDAEFGVGHLAGDASASFLVVPGVVQYVHGCLLFENKNLHLL